MHDHALTGAPLGNEVLYPEHYDASLLFPIERILNRAQLSLPTPWYGADIWNAYELSWLNLKGKPVVALARFTFPWDSPRLVESKSFKLYLNSFSEERFDTAEQVRGMLARDLSNAAGAQVEVFVTDLRTQGELICRPLSGQSIDEADITITRYEPSPDLLRCVSGEAEVTETLQSDLLKSNCPVTGQPDWGSVQISYSGPQIEQASLLEYVVSLRRHTEFHEHCVEKMYCDIWKACKPRRLLVYARYTRRGGLDINPWRSSQPMQVEDVRTLRQ